MPEIPGPGPEEIDQNKEILQKEKSFDISRETQKSISDKEYFGRIDNELKEFKKDEYDQLGNRSILNLEHIRSIDTINECTRFLQKLDTAEGKKFIKKYYQTKYDYKYKIKPDDLTESRKIIISEIINKIIDMLSYQAEKKTDIEKYQYSPDKEREPISPQTMDNLLNFLSESNILNSSEKISIINTIIKYRTTYWHGAYSRMGSTTDDKNRQKITQRQDLLKNELYGKISQRFPQETNRIAQDLIQSIDISFEKLIDSHKTNFLINNLEFQRLLLNNKEKIKNNTLNEFQNTVDYYNKDENKNLNQKKDATHTYKRHHEEKIKLFFKKAANIENQENREKIKKEFSEIFEEIQEKTDKIWLNYSNGEFKQFGTDYSIFTYECMNQNKDDYLLKLDRFELKSEKVKQELFEFKNYFNLLMKTANINNFDNLVINQIKENFNYDNYKEFFQNSPEKLENNIKAFKMLGSVCELLPKNEATEIANNIILFKYENPINEVSKYIDKKIEPIKAFLTENLPHGNEYSHAFMMIPKIIPYLNYSNELKSLFQIPLIKDGVIEYFIYEGIEFTNIDNILLIWNNRENLGLSEDFFHSKNIHAKIIDSLSNRYLAYKDLNQLEPKLIEVFGLSNVDLNKVTHRWFSNYLSSASAYPDNARYMLKNKEKFHLDDTDFKSKDIQVSIIRGLCGLIENAGRLRQEYITDFIELAKSIGVDTKNEIVKETALNSLNSLVKELALSGTAPAPEKIQSLLTLMKFLKETFDLPEKFILENFANVAINLMLNRKYKIALVIIKGFNIDIPHNIPENLKGFKDKIETGNKILSNIDNPYFENKDAKNTLGSFLDRYQKGDYSEEFFNKIIFSSEKMRNVKKAMATTMAIETLYKNIDSSIQKVDFSFLENKQKYNEIIKSLNQHLIDKACKLLFSDKNIEEAKNVKAEIEKLIESDDKFAEDFNVMINSAAIYAKKYPPNSSEYDKVAFKELTSSIRKALELDLIRNKENYENNRFTKSKFQFDNLFSELPGINRDQIEKEWLDTSLVVKDILDSRDISQLEMNKNKLQEVKTMLNGEIIPDLKKLFLEKLQGLEIKAKEESKQQKIFQTKLEVFKEYLLDEKGNLRKDIINVYRNLSKQLKIMGSSPVPKTEKEVIGIRRDTMKTIKETLSAIYRLGMIDPNKIEKNVRYEQEVTNNTKILSENLHKLTIVDKKKKPQEIVGSNLEFDLRGHLDYLDNVMSKDTSSNLINTQTQFVVDFNSLARCPELTGSCQRLTEVTGHNESAYSRILDGIDELIDLWELKPTGNQMEKHQRLARCFTELSVIKLENNEKKLAVLLDRVYTHPEYSRFQNKLTVNIIKIALQRFQKDKEINLVFSDKYFSQNTDLLTKMADKWGYKFIKSSNIEYFVNESNLKIPKGKYYDSISGHENTTASHYSTIQTAYILEPK